MFIYLCTVTVAAVAEHILWLKLDFAVTQGSDSVPPLQCTRPSWLPVLVLFCDEFWSSAEASELLIKLVILLLDLVICLVLANPIADQWKTL